MHDFCLGGAATCAILAGVLSGIIKTTPSNFGPFEGVLKYLQGSAWWMLLVVLTLGAIFGVGAKWFAPPWVWKSIRRILDHVREEGFTSKIEGEQLHHHRVTLFRRVRWCWCPVPFRHWLVPWGWGYWPWSGWMVQISRSGDTESISRTAFLLPSDLDKSEGIIGLAWQTRDVKTLHALPTIDENSTDDEIAAYATQTLMPAYVVKRRVKARKPCPRALCAIPIEVDNKPWGMLVLDSRRPNTINYEENTSPAFTALAQVSLGELLKGV